MKQYWKYVPWGTEVEEYDTLEAVKRDISVAYAMGAEEQAYAIVTDDNVVVEAVWENDNDCWLTEEEMLGQTLDEVLDSYACGR